MAKGTLYIISAASGAGKTSLISAVLDQVDDLVVSVSHTTRAPREGEVDGVNYHFVDQQRFETMIEASEFFESARVFGNMYGTSSQHIQEQLQAGKDVILEIDWQGARQIRTLMADCRSIFIVPPTTEALRERLESRGQDDSEIIDRRMREAISEMSHYVEFDYLIINDDFEQAKTELAAIIVGNRMLHMQQQNKHEQLLIKLLANAE